MRELRADIQVLRGIAVLAVVLFHAFPEIFPLGYLGVDAFFVISGFVVTPLLLRMRQERRGVRLFYYRRFLRLSPALSSFLLITTPLFLLIGSIYSHEIFALQGILSIFSLANFGAYKFSGDYFAPLPNPLLHLWSLSVEMQILIILPLLLTFLISKRSKSLKYVIVYALVIVISIFLFIFPNLIEFFSLKFGIQNLEQFAYYMPSHRMWQFLMGGLTYLSTNSGYPRQYKKATRILLLIIIMILITNSISSFALSIYVTVIVCGLIYGKVLVKLPLVMSSILIFLGFRSYSIYLFHYPTIYLANYSPLWIKSENDSNYLLICIAIIFSIILGSLNYQLIEQRFRRSDYKFGEKSQKLVWVALFPLVPLILLILMLHIEKENYFGLNHDAVNSPLYPAKIDQTCYIKSKDSPCLYKFNESHGKKILLIGDSFAGHLVETIKDLGTESGYNVAIWVDLPCDMDFSNDTPGSYAYSDCAKKNILIYDWIKRNNPDVIILSDFITNNNELIRIKKVSSILKKMTPKLILIENNPIFPDENTFFRSRTLLSQLFNPSYDLDFDKFVPVNDMQLSYKRFADNLSFWARGNNLTTISSWDLFCSEFNCFRYGDGDWYFSDYNHFSIEGAKKLSPLLKTAIDF